MAKLPGYRRIFTTDYEKQYQQLVDSLSVSINQGFDSLYNALNNNLTLGDNSTSTIKTITLSVDSNGVPNPGSQFTLNTTTKVIGMQVVSAINNTNNKTYPTSQPFITFSQNSNIITINNISGLQTSNSYTLTIITFT